MPDNYYDHKFEDYFEIGRIPKLRPEIDPVHSDGSDNISEYLKKKMSVIDLIPCTFTTNISNILNSNSHITKNFQPEIKYQDAASDYSSILYSYGLMPYSFLRLYLTDMSTVTDEMSNDYAKNIIDDTLNSASIQRVMNYFGSAEKSFQSTGTNSPSYVDAAAKFIGVDVSATTKDTADLIQAVLTHGTRIAFPKIWSSSSYAPNLLCDLKLISPYGHPKAIDAFIIKPLAYLLILLSPTTKYGITTERPNYLTLKSYGLSNLALCYPKSISIKRGGDDSSYNSYKQPLTVEINLTFEAVTEGFACYKNWDTQHPEHFMFAMGGDSYLPLKSFENDFDMPSTLFPTLKNMVNSFRPFKYTPTTPPQNQGSAQGGNNLLETAIEAAALGGLVGLVGGSLINDESTVPTITPTPLETPSDTSINIIPPSVDLIDENPVINVDSDVEVIEVDIATDKEKSSVKEYNLNDFEPDENLNSIEKIILNNETTQYVLDLGSKFKNENESVVLRIRNTTNTIPGVWSDYLLISRNTVDQSTVLFSTSISPGELTFNQDFRWILYNPVDESTYGPYIGVTDNKKSVPNGEYLLDIINLDGEIQKRFTVNIENEDSTKQAFLEEAYGSMLADIIIPEGYDISGFTYFLVSDKGETSFNDNIDLTEDLAAGKYYILVKYNNQIIDYLNETITNSITITENTLISLNFIIEEIDGSLKITSITEV